ncbi:MAG: helix-turn-helix domain-containing protein [Firmicutes bacterium]|nr:helix-turn-helix domain-containing protein [Bacillota bacterium]
MTEITQIIGDRIRMYRTRKNLSQDALGEMAGLYGAYIGQLERGEKNATLESIGKVARALDLPFEVLFENIIGGGTQNEISRKCYNLLTPLPLKDQAAILALVEDAIAFKNA